MVAWFTAWSILFFLYQSRLLFIFSLLLLSISLCSFSNFFLSKIFSILLEAVILQFLYDRLLSGRECDHELPVYLWCTGTAKWLMYSYLNCISFFMHFHYRRNMYQISFHTLNKKGRKMIADLSWSWTTSDGKIAG